MTRSSSRCLTSLTDKGATLPRFRSKVHSPFFSRAVAIALLVGNRTSIEGVIESRVHWRKSEHELCACRNSSHTSMAFAVSQRMTLLLERPGIQPWHDWPKRSCSSTTVCGYPSGAGRRFLPEACGGAGPVLQDSGGAGRKGGLLPSGVVAEGPSQAAACPERFDNREAAHITQSEVARGDRTEVG